jgi:hypothetical protein
MCRTELGCFYCFLWCRCVVCRSGRPRDFVDQDKHHHKYLPPSIPGLTSNLSVQRRSCVCSLLVPSIIVSWCQSFVVFVILGDMTGAINQHQHRKSTDSGPKWAAGICGFKLNVRHGLVRAHDSFCGFSWHHFLHMVMVSNSIICPYDCNGKSQRYGSKAMIPSQCQHTHPPRCSSSASRDIIYPS